MTSDVHHTNRMDPASRGRPQNQTDVSPRTNSGIQIKGPFYKATDFVINGGTYSVIAGDSRQYLGSTHNERSNNSKVTNTTDSYNDSSTRVRKEYTKSEARAVDGTGSVPRSFTGEGRELGTGRMVSGEGPQGIQERRRRLADAAERRRSTTPSHVNSEGDALQQSQQEKPAGLSVPNGDVHRDQCSVTPLPPPSPDSGSASSESDLSDTETNEYMHRSTRTKRAKTMIRGSSVRGTTLLTETQVQSLKSPVFFAPTGLPSPTSDSNIRMQVPSGVLRTQRSYPTVPHQPMPAVTGYPFVPHGTANASPAFPRPQQYIHHCGQSPPRPVPSPNLNVDLNPDWKAKNHSPGYGRCHWCWTKGNK